MRVSIEQMKAGESVLHTDLTNTSSATLELYRGDLPVFRHSLLVVAYTALTREPLEMVFPLETAPPGQVRIPPGSTITGDVELSSSFPTLPSVLKREDVSLFWRYDLKPIQATSHQYIYGGLTLRRR
jgi:hypothetical protein